MQSQLSHWTSKFGDEYHHRNERLTEVSNRGNLWGQVLNLMPRVNMDILEVGAGLGANLEAIRAMYRTIRLNPTLYALEPNESARARLHEQFHLVYDDAEHIVGPDKMYDLVFTYGVLIHLENPLAAIREMYRVSRRFVMCAEYFAPTRRLIPYRDDEQTGLPVHLAADDYGRIWQENFDLRLLGYGFCWKPATGLDNVTWWLFERKDFQLRPMSRSDQMKAIIEAGGKPASV